jgi:hypothetical protein
MIFERRFAEDVPVMDRLQIHPMRWLLKTAQPLVPTLFLVDRLNILKRLNRRSIGAGSTSANKRS